MGRKRHRAKAASASGEEQRADPQSIAAPSTSPTTVASADGKKRRLGDGNSAKRSTAPKLKLIKLNGAGSGGKSAVESSKAAPAVTPESTTAPVEGRKKKKKKKSGKSKAGVDAAAAASAPVEKLNPASTSAIDDLFASLKTAKKEQARADEQKQKEEVKAAQRAQQEKQQLQAHIKKLEAQNTNSIGQAGVNPDPRPVRYDDDGLPIYTEDSLHIGKGGDTADCPFDCWCCF